METLYKGIGCPGKNGVQELLLLIYILKIMGDFQGSSVSVQSLFKRDSQSEPGRKWITKQGNSLHEVCGRP